MTISLSLPDMAVLITLLALTGTALGVLGVTMAGAPWQLSAWLSVAGMVVTPALTLIVLLSGQGSDVQGLLGLDGAAALFVLFACAAGAATVILELGSVDRETGGRYALVLLAVSGATMSLQSAHILPLVIGLSTLYVASTALVGSRTAWQFFRVQAAGLACTLFGATLLYGTGGTWQTDTLIAQLAQQAATGMLDPLAALGLGLVIAGLFPPLAVVPFHAWLTGILHHVRPHDALFISLLPPAVAAATLVRFGGARLPQVESLLVSIGAVSVLYGYAKGLCAHSLHDALAGIVTAQSGYLILSASLVGASSLVSELMTLGLTLSCLWTMVINARREDGTVLALDDIAGLGARRPWLASATTICLFNVAGVLPLAISVNRLPVLRTAIERGYGWAAGIALVGTGFAWLLAGRWAIWMWMRPQRDRSWLPTAPEAAMVALVGAGGTLAAGLYADAIMNWIARLIARL